MEIVIFIICLLLLLFIAKGLDNRTEFSQFNISSVKIPKEFDGFRILHISDSHNAIIPKIYDKIKSFSPDIIVITGDVIDERNNNFKNSYEFLDNLFKIAPCYIVSGNHDLWHKNFDNYYNFCKKNGAYFLRNQSVSISKNGKSILISGMDDVFTKVRMEKKIKEYLKNFSPSENYQILLFHRANGLDYIKDYGFDLILSGHMHGGHIRLPFIGGILSPMSSVSEIGKFLFPSYSKGLYKHKNTDMIVNAGYGNPLIVPRFYNRREIGVITLSHKENK